MYEAGAQAGKKQEPFVVSLLGNHRKQRACRKRIRQRAASEENAMGL
jgi:hypothetical protein